MGVKLFDEKGDDDISEVDIDKDYASRFEHNKKREDLQRYQELEKKGVIDESDEQGSQFDDDSSSSSSSSSDSSSRIKPSKDDLHFFNALIKVNITIYSLFLESSFFLLLFFFLIKITVITKRKMSLVKRAQEEMMEEYYKLDYEDTIWDLKTRFKYAKLKPNRYGLSTAEILMMDEKGLNQYVSLKKHAPYIEKEGKFDKNKRYQQKLKNKELGEGGKLDGHKSDKNKRFRDGSDLSTSVTGNEHRKVQMKESNGDDRNLSRRAKRRYCQAEKLPQSRLVAYGRRQRKLLNTIRRG
ncbi:Kri1_C domain-containing protein [Cephalotus follicularis]|uniref:Kri1_C domain-containing protein n=1 Tax=Cephalotus follicularis TaxID=3775 RepID=A0A1Q3CHT7_CEPFO|nr:Kri1_C domain-containing protein [Cephalotus follicularis]